MALALSSSGRMKATPRRCRCREGLVEVRPLGGGRPAVFLRPGEGVVPSTEAYLRGRAVEPGAGHRRGRAL